MYLVLEALSIEDTDASWLELPGELDNEGVVGGPDVLSQLDQLSARFLLGRETEQRRDRVLRDAVAVAHVRHLITVHIAYTNDKGGQRLNFIPQ